MKLSIHLRYSHPGFDTVQYIFTLDTVLVVRTRGIDKDDTFASELCTWRIFNESRLEMDGTRIKARALIHRFLR